MSDSRMIEWADCEYCRSDCCDMHVAAVSELEKRVKLLHSENIHVDSDSFEKNFVVINNKETDARADGRQDDQEAVQEAVEERPQSPALLPEIRVATNEEVIAMNQLHEKWKKLKEADAAMAEAAIAAARTPAARAPGSPVARTPIMLAVDSGEEEEEEEEEDDDDDEEEEEEEKEEEEEDDEEWEEEWEEDEEEEWQEREVVEAVDADEAEEIVEAVDEVEMEEVAEEIAEEVEVAVEQSTTTSTTFANGEVVVNHVVDCFELSQTPALCNQDLQLLFDERNLKDFRAGVCKLTKIDLSKKMGMTRMSKERLVVEKSLELLKPTPETSTDLFDMYTRNYLRMSCKFYEALGNPRKLKEFAEGTKHLICLLCPGETFNMHSNTNGYVCYGGRTSTHQHDHAVSLHPVVLAGVKANLFRIVAPKIVAPTT